MPYGQFFDARYPKWQKAIEQIAGPTPLPPTSTDQGSDQAEPTNSQGKDNPLCDLKRWDTLKVLISKAMGMEDFEVGLLILLKKEWLEGSRTEHPAHLPPTTNKAQQEALG